MFTHWFAYVMVGTFVAAVITMLLGVAGISKASTPTPAANRSTKLMMLRVGLCALLLAEIVIYVTCIKP